MKRLSSAMRAITLSVVTFAGHTVRISNVLPGLAGAAMVSWGAAMIYTPAGYITGGLMLLAIAYEINALKGRKAAERAAAAAMRRFE